MKKDKDGCLTGEALEQYLRSHKNLKKLAEHVKKLEEEAAKQRELRDATELRTN